MNSIFSSFDALSAEFLGQSLRSLNTKSPASGTTIKDHEQKKVKYETDRKQGKASYGGRWAPELDGLHCFESLVFH
ncbi:hypothetical protein Tco_1052541 [Tanacetum coccineum]